ncbi:hypothetical protein [Halorhodospira neutriphila]|uniref:Uncharacterized protein n=1 Tax=Halorhodospira neutriphila TaxID=168379 RepID=A0ABS1E374_9GAMM|nr:hypothetical protein [Halorhodospira neutriphila]MBK1725592.1 hypothetical protein [Halorhodospira neutriphila]
MAPTAGAVLAVAAYAGGEPGLVAQVTVAMAWFALVAIALCLGYSQALLASDDQRPPPRVQELCLAASILLAGLSYHSWVRPLIFPP